MPSPFSSLADLKNKGARLIDETPRVGAGAYGDHCRGLTQPAVARLDAQRSRKPATIGSSCARDWAPPERRPRYFCASV